MPTLKEIREHAEAITPVGAWVRLDGTSRRFKVEGWCVFTGDGKVMVRLVEDPEKAPDGPEWVVGSGDFVSRFTIEIGEGKW